MASMSPTSSAVIGPASDLEAPSSPAHYEGKSFMSQAVTEDDDTRMMDFTPEPSEKASRGKSKSQPKDQPPGQPVIGKIRHLKKEDGEPLWRKDIQYDFLRAVFDDEMAVFTNSYEPDRPPQVFADLYIDTMARSSKTSKVLRDKLLSDREAAKNMAMVCLLVNIGRMNTTLNFFPEMRAQLRTYHAIPSLQANQDVNHDPHAYKQLQDAPRLKSILKGGAEDRTEPESLNKIKAQDVPRTNPVNLLFVICANAAKVAELHFPPGQEFHDLIMKTNYSSQSRAHAFLWIMWFYLESDFTEEGCDENPFGPGVDYGVDVANQGVPRLEELTPEEEAQENVDTPSELEYGRETQLKRAKILEEDQAYIDNQNKRGSRASRAVAEEGPAVLPRIRPSRQESDMDSTRSTPPPKLLVHSARGSGRRGAPLKYQLLEGSTLSPAAAGQQGAESVGSNRKPRPPTAHQIAVERNRNERVEHTLDRGLRELHRKARRLRKQEGAIYRALRRVGEMQDPFEDSDMEEDMQRQLAAGIVQDGGKFRTKGLAGLVQLKSEKDDFGEEPAAYAAALRRVVRRLDRWSAYNGTNKGVVAPVKKRKKATVEEQDGANGTAEVEVDNDDTLADIEAGARAPKSRKHGGAGRASRGGANSNDNGDVSMLDVGEGEGEGEDADKTAGGSNSAAEEEELDEMERSLLGMAPGNRPMDSGSESD
ncbi:INO80 chromatin remodeling complex Ies1 [Sodiomyces alkalinus F11]|uniref:INO80 chromatin remodeling complex Ies1 n=1 Tax=Sodiomyces alkalinus (strain CBS 110278 / VKM F-3762 / F11) TaxID=1314773 RepID=A0A3N2Q8J0_SODAK|nr:INO80 chromatin remodeling complex Ies1 [Sodiomyces alkalinus F11]ROT43089.1 INO80 chromatin remodeling complex Ies1 [Sodiomyces alkalinus F11]